MLSSSSLQSHQLSSDFMASSEETRLDILHVHEIHEEEEKEEEKEEQEEEEKEEDEGKEGLNNLIVEAEMEVGKRMVETFLLMATVIAASCYAAMLTLSDNFGHLNDPTTVAYLLFVYSNLLAVFCAMLTVVSIIWSYFLERESAGRAVESSETFLALAMLFMSSAIVFGAAVVVKNSRMIQLGVLVFGLFLCATVYRFALPLVANTRWLQMMRLMGGRAHAR